MLTRTRLITLSSTVTVLLLLAVIAIASPYRLSLTFERTDNVAKASQLYDVPVTATPQLPTATSVPPTATEPPTATSVPPTATPAPTEPPIATRVPPTDAPKPTTPSRTVQDEPTAIGTSIVSTVVPTVAPTKVPGTPNVSIQKQASTTTARPGEAVTFTLLAQNTGSEIARDVVVTDRVPDVFTITDLKSTKGDVTVNGQTVSAYPVTLAPAERVTITITTRVRADAKAGEYRNIGLITTSTPGDTPENNTSTVTVTIAGGAPVKPSPTTQAFVPSRIPSTADPDLPTFAMIWGPWVMLAMMLVMFGSMVRFGMLRTRFVSVGLRTPPSTLSLAPSVPVKATHTTILSVDMDVAAVLTAWRAGTSLRDLTQQVARENPQANSVMVGLAVQQLIREQIGS